MKISVIGLGKLGLPFAFFLASKKNNVIGYDLNTRIKEKIDKNFKDIEVLFKKVIKKPSLKSIKVKTKKTAPATSEPKVDNLRISKTNEIKPEIKKVKKQNTEKREYKIKDYVVSQAWCRPNYGI